MAHFAKIENNKVVDVIVLSNEVIYDLDYPESEKIGQDFIKSIGKTGEWKQTSYNANFRGKYAGIGDDYDEVLDEFVSPVVEIIEEPLQ